MEHVAILNPKWGLLPKILAGEKKIESRWYLSKRAPWGKIHAGDIVYFKNSGEPVTVRAKVAKVLQFSDLTPRKVHEILVKYGNNDGIKPNDLEKYFQLFMDKKYCLLIYLKDVQKIKPFEVDKRGFGAMSAWLLAEDIKRVAVRISSRVW